MRRSIAVLENSFSVVPGVTTIALLASRTQSGSCFLWGLSGLPGGEGGRGEGATSEPGTLTTGAVGNRGALAAKPAKGLEDGAGSTNEDCPTLEEVEDEPEPPAEVLPSDPAVGRLRDRPASAERTGLFLSGTKSARWSTNGDCEFGRASKFSLNCSPDK